MAKIARFVPPGGEVQSIVIRCFQSRFLLRPSDRVNELIVGVLARAQERTGVKVFHTVFLSNHAHLLVEVADARQRAAFMHFVNTNVAREIGPLHSWSGKFWQGPYLPSIVAPEEAAQVSALRYLLAQGVKEHLVAKVNEWPGLHTGSLALHSDRVSGVWVDRTGLYYARRTIKGRKNLRPEDYEHEVQLVLSPLPCWSHLSVADQRARLRELILEIEEAAAAERRLQNLLRPLGRWKILHQNPRQRPQKTKKSPGRFIYAASQELRQRYLDALKLFHQAYRQAAALLRSGFLEVQFPEGCFPPPRPFVAVGLELRRS